MSLPTASRIERALACPASQVLPQAPEDTARGQRGAGIHDFAKRSQEVGREKALAEVPEDLREECEALDLSAFPSGAAWEVALAWNPTTGAARELSRGDPRGSMLAGKDEYAGTADMLGVDDEAVYVDDLKTGRGYVAPAAENKQLAALALYAARAYGRVKARVGILRAPEGSKPTWDVAELDAFALDSVAEELRALPDRIWAAKKVLLAGGTPNVRVGPWCTYCAAKASCPVQGALIRRMAGEPDVAAKDLKALLTPETAAQAYWRLKAAKDALKLVESALYAYARETPIALGGGRVFGPTSVARESLSGPIVRRVLLERYGQAVADAACDYEASKASVKRALRQLPGTLAELEREALGAIREAGGVEKSASERMEEYQL